MATIHPERHRANKDKIIGYRVKWRDESGKQHSRQFKRQSEAREWMNRTNLTDRTVNTPRAKQPTLAEIHTTWTASRRVSRGRTATDASLATHFGELAAMPIGKITPSKIRTWVADLSDAGLSPATISALLRMIRSVFDTAIDDGLITTNPAARVRGPRQQQPPLDAGDVFTTAELEQLITLTPKRWRALIGFLGYVGCRWSEALAVTVADLDLLRRRVHVGHRVLEEVNGDLRIREGGKTRGSDRVVPLPTVVVDLLAEHLAEFPAGRDDLVFRTSAGTPPMRSNFRRQVWSKTTARLAEQMISTAIENAERAGRDPDKDHAVADTRARAERVRTIPTRNLRHGAAAAMLQVLPPLEVARRLGHSRPSITLDVYARLLPVESEGVDPYDAALRRSDGTNDGTTDVPNRSVVTSRATS